MKFVLTDDGFYIATSSEKLLKHISESKKCGIISNVITLKENKKDSLIVSTMVHWNLKSFITLWVHQPWRI